VETSDEVVEHGLIIFLHDVLYHIALPEVVAKRLQLLVSDELMGELGVCGLGGASLIEDFNGILIVLNEATEGRVVGGLDGLALVLIPKLVGALEVFELDATMVLVAEHLHQHINQVFP
jgi:hypothetical protein